MSVNNGERGEQGITGLTGPQGERGQQGDLGATGSRGSRGKSGINLRTIIVIVVLPLFAYLYSNQVSSVQTLRDACARGNLARESELQQRQALVDVNIERVKAASSIPEREANQYALEAYRESRNDLIASQAEVAVEPGSVIVDCNRTYPKPFPLN